MDIAEDNHCQLNIQLNKISCIEELYQYFDQELAVGYTNKVDRECVRNLMLNFGNCNKVKMHNIQKITLNITGWKSMSRKNERLFDYFLDVLQTAEKERLDNIKFNFKLIDEW